MLRWFCVFVSALLLLSPMAHADTVTLRPRIEASGPAITLGDVFDGVGAEIAGRAIAPSPSPGQITALSAPMLQAVASAAGLEWTPPPGMSSVQVVRPGGMRATLAPANGVSRADAAVRRGQTVTLLFAAPGMHISTSARALEDAGVGESVRLVNLTSNRTISATVTGPGAASAQ